MRLATAAALLLLFAASAATASFTVSPAWVLKANGTFAYESSINVYNDLLLTGLASAPNLLVVEAASGIVSYTIPTAGSTTSGILRSGSVVYYSTQTSVIAVDVYSRETKWSFSTGDAKNGD